MNIEFWLASELYGDAKIAAEKSGIKDGIVAVKTYVGSPPQFEVDSITGSPTEYLRDLATKEGLDLDTILVDAFGEYPED